MIADRGDRGGWSAAGELAALQHGVAALWQLERLGFSRSRVQTGLMNARLHRLYLGVYSLGHTALSDDGRRMAAVLACGPGAHLSHLWGAALHGIRATPRGIPEISVPWTSRRRPRGIRLHQVASLTQADTVTRRGIPVTSVARTLLDLASLGSGAEVRDAIARAQRAGILDVGAIVELLERSRGRRGVAVLRLETEELRTGERVLRSELEHRFRELFRQVGIPEPVVNGLIRLEYRSLEVDFHWPDARLVVEADGYRFHSDPGAHEEDRRRDQELKQAGWEVLRFTWRQLTREPVRTARIVAELLAARPSEPPPRR